MKKLFLLDAALMRPLVSIVVFLIGFTGSTQASTLVGTASLSVADDLTVIETDAGVVEEWLDFSYTLGMTSSAAVGVYATDGFRFATDTEVSDMFSAFLLPSFTVSASGTPQSLGLTVADSASFLDYFGTTLNGDSAIAFFDDLGDSISHNAYVCLGDTCGNDGFVRNFHIDSGPTFGQFLVRTSAVPVPAAVWLFGSGLIGIAGIGRRKKRN